MARSVVRRKTRIDVIQSMSHYQQSLNDTNTHAARSPTVKQQRDLRRSGRECVSRSSVHARSLFKDHRVTPIGPMLRATDSIFIVNIVLQRIFSIPLTAVKFSSVRFFFSKTVKNSNSFFTQLSSMRFSPWIFRKEKTLYIYVYLSKVTRTYRIILGH